MVAGITSGPSHATLMSTYDLDVTYIERTPRYPRYCVKKVTCCECDEGKESTCIHDPTAPFCSDIPEALGPSCDPVVATGACQPLVVDSAHPQGKRWRATPGRV
jgi:hypothetical protein